MKSGFLHVLSGMVLASAAVMVPGCSQDTLESGSQNLNMAYTPNPSGAGRFDTASFTFDKIEALPADPDEAALYGVERILFSFSPFIADLTVDAPVTYSNIALSPGTYNVTLIQVTPPALVDEEVLPPPPPGANCLDWVSTFNAQSPVRPFPELPAFFRFRTPTDNLSNLSFTVQPGQTRVALTVNVPGLIAAYQQSFSSGCRLCTNCNADSRSTLTTFNTPAYRAAVLANITIE